MTRRSKNESRKAGASYREHVSKAVVVPQVALLLLFAGQQVASADSVGKGNPAQAISSNNAAEKIDVDENDQKLFGRWMAAGSGCRADSADTSVKSDVQLVAAEYDAENPKVLKVTFALPDFRLRPLEQTPERPTVSSVNFARECALRFNVNPPAGKIIRSASAETQIEVSKEKEVKLFVAGALKLGATTLTQQRTQFDNAESFRFRRHPLLLVPGKNPTDEMPEVGCAEKKIVGVDLTLLTNKPTESALAEARIHGNGAITITVDLDDCPVAPAEIKK